MATKKEPEETQVATRPETLRSKTLKRDRVPRDNEPEPTPPPVSAGAIDKVIDLAFNPSRDKIREMTVIDRMQGRLLPQLDLVNMMRRYCLEVALFRQDETEYRRITKRDRPVQPDAIDDFLFRMAQWQKSVAGKNLERATDIALAEVEIRAGEEEEGSPHGDPWKE